MTASSKVYLLCYAAPFVIAAYYYVRLIPQGLRALQPVGFADLFKRPPRRPAGAFYFAVPFDNFLRVHQK